MALETNGIKDLVQDILNGGGAEAAAKLGAIMEQANAGGPETTAAAGAALGAAIAELTPDQIKVLQDAYNPYAPLVARDPDAPTRRVLALSATNLSAEYLRRFELATVVGFLHQMAQETADKVSEDARSWVDNAEAAAKKAGAAAAKASGRSAPPTSDDVMAWAKQLELLAGELAEAEAKASTLRAEVAAAVAKESEVATAAANGEATEEEKAAATRAAASSIAIADEAVGATAALTFAATCRAFEIGQEASARFDQAAAEVKKFPTVRGIVDAHPEVIRRSVEQADGTKTAPPTVAKAIVAEWLSGLFEFDPSAHVRKEYRDFRRAGVDPGPREDEGASADDWRICPETLIAGTPVSDGGKALVEKMTDAEKAAVEKLAADPRTAAAAISVLAEPELADAIGLASANPAGFRQALVLGALDKGTANAIAAVPADTFHRLKFYQDVNYESLREVVHAIWGARPDLDWAICPFEVFEGHPAEVDAAFEKFQQRHESQLMTDLVAVEVGSWTLMGSFKKNRDRLEFYNKNTHLLKAILDQMKSDSTLGKELMKKRVTKEKAKNIVEAGPDAPGLAAYREKSSAYASGGERGISDRAASYLERAARDLAAETGTTPDPRRVQIRADELEALDTKRAEVERFRRRVTAGEDLDVEDARAYETAVEELNRLTESLEVPDDAVQIDVYNFDAGTGSFEREVMYVEAEDEDNHVVGTKVKPGGAGLGRSKGKESVE